MFNKFTKRALFALIGGVSSLGLLVSGSVAQSNGDTIHTVVISGQNTSGSSDYVIRATGAIEKVDGTLNGHSVSINRNDRINGNRAEGEVVNGADGYRIFGDISDIHLENPNAAQVYINSQQRPQQARQCQKQIVAQSIEVLDGQGAGEGRLELVVHVTSGNKSDRDRATVAPGQSAPLGSRLNSFFVDRGSSEEQILRTSIREREVGRDVFTGDDDFGSTESTITLECGETETVTHDVTIQGRNDGKVRVTYDIQDTFQTN